jgi:hypothetical protein
MITFCGGEQNGQLCREEERQRRPTRVEDPALGID